MEEGERITSKKDIQQQIDVLSSMLRERKMMLETMAGQLENNPNTLQASSLDKISTTNSGKASVSNTSSHFPAKFSSYSTTKTESFIHTVILKDNTYQTSFKTTEHMILNAKAPTESHHSASVNKPTSRANNIFFNPKFQSSTSFNRLQVESSNIEIKRYDNDLHKRKPSTSTQYSNTKNGIYVNPNFRSRISQNPSTQKTSEACSQQSKSTNIENNKSNVTLPTTSRHSDHPISSELREKSESIKEKPRTLHVNPKLIQKESLNFINPSFLKLCGNNAESNSSEPHPTGKQPLTSRNSQDSGYQNRSAVFPNTKSTVENREINVGKNKCEVKDVSKNNHQPSCTRTNIIQQNIMGCSFNSESSRVISNSKKGGVNYRIMNSKVYPALKNQRISENSSKYNMSFKSRNSVLNRGRKYAWASTTGKINNVIPRLSNNHYKFTKAQSNFHNNLNVGNVPVQRNKFWRKPPALKYSMEMSNRKTASTLTDSQTCSPQKESSLNSQESVPCTSKTSLVAVSPTKVIRKLTASPKSVKMPDLSAVTKHINSPYLRKKFPRNINQNNVFSPKTTLVAVSRTKVIRKPKASQKDPLQDSNRQIFANRRNQKSLEQRTNKYYYTNSSSKIDLLRMKYKALANFNILNKHRNVSQQSIGLNISMKQADQRVNVASRLKFVADQKHKAFNSKAYSQNSSRLISLSRSKLIREQSSITKSVPKRTQICIAQYATKNSRPIRRFNNSYLAMSRNRYSLIRDRLRMRRQIHPYFQSAYFLRMKYRHFNAISRRYPLPRSNSKRQQLQSRNNEFKRSARKRMKSVTIGGIKYHSSRLKLQRKLSIKDFKINQKQLVSVRGEKFEVGNGGRTLKRIGEGPARLNKVYLGGVAFIRSKENESTMLRTNTHNVQQLLRQAKQRSIAQLTKKMRKNNEPCPIYHRFGRCPGKEKGSCSRVHDKKHVAVCRRFLRGDCDKKNCLLSHVVGPTKMPTCCHFLAGVCMRENCPYLHVKLNSSAPICLKFLRGYCQLAEKCKNRHIEICPEYEETSKCSKGKYCPYPHPKNYHRSNFISSQNAKTEDKKSAGTELSEQTENRGVVPKKSESDVNVAANRYYMAYSDSKLAEVTLIAENLALDKANDSGTSWLKSRPKIGQLGVFIPFEENK